jgi:hypothetical protein
MNNIRRWRDKHIRGAGKDAKHKMSQPLDTQPAELQTIEKPLLDPRWINIDELRKWLDICVCDHGKDCQPLYARSNCRPAWLIDVLAECLVPTQRSDQYMALGYVWGDVVSSETTIHNLDSMQQEGALAPTSNIVIPRTIRHTMGLVRLMVHRYLWVDRFCICQDDAESKHIQINQMADIYENATLTVIAANGWDADHGLRGIKGVTEPRDLSPNIDVASYGQSLRPENSVWVSFFKTYRNRSEY